MKLRFARRRTTWLAICLLYSLFPLLALAAEDNSQKKIDPSEEPPVKIKVDVDLTLLFATVTNAQGFSVPHLTKEDFELAIDGKPTAIDFFTRESELPLRIALLLDISLSTAKDLKYESDAALKFLRNLLRQQDRTALFAFSADVLQLTSYTDRIETLSNAIQQLRPQSGTSLYDAVYLATQSLKPQSGRKVIILVSDGADTTSDTSFHAALELAIQAETIIYSIGVIPIRSAVGRNIAGEHALITLSEDTGGKAFFPDTLSELDVFFTKISDELRTQYTFGFYGTGLDSSQHRHQITLSAKKAGLVVRTRRAFYSQVPHR